MLSANERPTSQFYTVPSYVPDWGWTEFRIMAACLLTGRIVRGEGPERLCDLVRRNLGVGYALPVNRGRYGIQLGLEAIGVGKGDEVVLPSHVCEAALEPIINVGARPVFSDVDPNLHPSVETVRRVTNRNTKCVIVPHLYGNVAPIDEIEEFLDGSGIPLIDDAAQSFGARRAGRLVGTFGVCGVVGCGPGKSLAGPAGGVLVTDDPKIYERAVSITIPEEKSSSVFRRVCAFWTWFRFRRYFLGFKRFSDQALSQSGKSGDRVGRMSNLDARIAIRQLESWASYANRRRAHAKRILQVLRQCARFCISDLSSSGVVLRLVFVLPAGAPTAEEAVRFLARSGIEGRRTYEPLHREMKAQGVELPKTDALWERTLLIPISNRLFTTKIQRSALEEFSKWLLGEKVETDHTTHNNVDSRGTSGGRLGIRD